MPSVEQLVALTVLVIVVVAGLLLLGRQGWTKLGAGKYSASRDTSGDPRDLGHLEVTLEQYSEVATALDALVDLDAAQIETGAKAWFTTLATRLATCLKTQADEHYRVAIWLDDPNFPDHFIAVGHGLFNANEPEMGKLERDYTIGGLAFRSVTGTYYCRDTATDPNYKPRRAGPQRYHSVFAIALGSLTDPWGVMTADARQANGFDEREQMLIRRFGELASVGALIWYSRVTPPGPPAEQSPDPEGL